MESVGIFRAVRLTHHGLPQACPEPNGRAQGEQNNYRNLRGMILRWGRESLSLQSVQIKKSKMKGLPIDEIETEETR